jgi:endo-1,4-beta-mannosidase
MVTELEKARELGVNTVRVGIPYDHHDTMNIIWGNPDRTISIGPRIGYVMSQFLQIAASYNMKVIFVLFDWYDPFLQGAKPDEQTNLTYLKGIVGPFVNDDRVLAWDVYNEPDFSESWQSGKQSAFIYWLRDMAQLVHDIDNRHPVTVGVGIYSDLWLPAGDSSTILSFSDFVAFHCYDAGALTAQITAIKAHTGEPVLLEEMGWPTSLGGEAPIPNAIYDEPTQTFLYTTMLNAGKAANIAGIMQWTLWDYWGSDTAFVPGHERFFGLVKADGTFKPAAGIFKENYLAPPLPSGTYPQVPLDTAARPKTRP